MSFDLSFWRQSAAAMLQAEANQAIDAAEATATLCGLALWPLVAYVATAARSGASFPLAAALALGRVAQGDEGGRIAEQLQRWHSEAQQGEPPTPAAVMAWLTAEQATLPTAVPALLAELGVLGALPDATRPQLVQRITAELQASHTPTAVIAHVVGGTAVVGDSNVVTGEFGVSIAARETAEVSGVVVGGRGNTVSVTQLVKDPSQLDETTLRRIYLERVLESANQLSLGGIDPKTAADGATRLRLAAVYTTARVNQVWSEKDLSNATMTFGDIKLKELKKVSFSAPALSWLNLYDRATVLGNPGSGKSTFINYICICMAGELLAHPLYSLLLLRSPLAKEMGAQNEPLLAWDHGPLLPVRVVLREFAARGLPRGGETASAEDFWNFIIANLQEQALPEFAPYLKKTLLERGGIILFDGLDEVPSADARRVQIKQMIEDVGRTFAKCRLVVTSRTYAYQRQEWQLEGFEVAELAPFNAAQIEQFIDSWYDHTAEVRSENLANYRGRAALLKQAILSSERLRALAERPLLLTLMVSLHAWRGGSLPQRREELYAGAVDLLLDTWEQQRVVVGADGHPIVIQPSLEQFLKVGKEQIRRLLNRLAFEAHAGQADLGETADIGRNTLVLALLDLSEDRDLPPDRLVQYLSERAGLLLPRGNGIYTFPHRTFQEYLAASHLADFGYPERVAALLRQEPERWREVALLAAAKATSGGIAQLWPLVHELVFEEPTAAAASADQWAALLAAQAIVEFADLAQLSAANRAKVAQVGRWLEHVISGAALPPRERAAASRFLALLGDQRQEVMLVDAMRLCLVPAGPFWMGAEGDAARPLHENGTLNYHYWIGRFPITNAQFEAFVADGGYAERAFWEAAAASGRWREGEVMDYERDGWRRRPRPQGEPFHLPNHPVVGISWYEAHAYVKWLTARWRTMGWLRADWQVDLPSTAEWEKAASGGWQIPPRPILATAAQVGSTAAPNLIDNFAPMRRYPWEDEAVAIAERANIALASIGSTSGVGCFAGGRSPYGCEELIGNVWEWTRSLEAAYPYQPDDGREPAEVKLFHAITIRGGAYWNSLEEIEQAQRTRPPHEVSPSYGFRVVVRPVRG